MRTRRDPRAMKITIALCSKGENETSATLYTELSAIKKIYFDVFCVYSFIDI